MPDYKTEHEILMAMTPAERKVVLLSEKVESEQYWLEDMLTGWRDERSVSMKDIREQRKRVQIWTKRLSGARQTLTKNEHSDKQSQSSDNSVT